MRILTTLITACLLATPALAVSPEWERIVEGEHRSEANRARDVWRNPRQTLEFFQVEPDHTVVEIWPGAGWYTEILAPLLRYQGKLYAAHWPADAELAYFRETRERYEAKLAANPEIYDQVVITELLAPTHIEIAPRGSVDRVLTFRSAHAWIRQNSEDEVFGAFFQALKPGGILGVVTHRAPPGTPVQTMQDTGYVSEEHIKEVALRAGFEFVRSSEINANPKDTADHPQGVWTLPPSLRLGDKDRERYEAIGESDRMTLKFRKPL